MVLISFTVKRSPVKSNTISRFGNSPPNSCKCRQSIIYIIFLSPYSIVFVHERGKTGCFHLVWFYNSIRKDKCRSCNSIAIIIPKSTIRRKNVFTRIILINYCISKIIEDVNRIPIIFSINPISLIRLSRATNIERSNPYFCRMRRTIIRPVMVIEPHTAHIYFFIFLIFIKPINSTAINVTNKITNVILLLRSRNITNNVIMFYRQL